MKRYIDSDFQGDLELCCTKCGTSFWWPVQEQKQGTTAPTLCANCRPVRLKPRRPKKSTALVRTSGEQSTALVPAVLPQLPALPDLPAPPTLPELPPEFTDRAAFFDDIKRLLRDAEAPIEDRLRTPLEWWRGVDVRAEQLARKMQASQTASELVRHRTALFEHLQQMIAAATNAELARLRAHIALQHEQLRVIELQEELNQRRALAAEKFVTQQLTERAKQRKLLEAFRPEPEEPDEGEVAIEEHRKRLHLHAKAGQAVISDFLSAVEEICDTRYSLHEKSLRIRKLIDVFQISEDELPRRAREILEASEVVR